MPSYIVLLSDNEARADQRHLHMQAHLNFLSSHADAIVAAGPVKDAETDRSTGGVWLVEAENVRQVRSLLETDPFWPTGLRESVQILLWQQVFRDGQPLAAKDAC